MRNKAKFRTGYKVSSLLVKKVFDKSFGYLCRTNIIRLNRICNTQHLHSISSKKELLRVLLTRMCCQGKLRDIKLILFCL